MWSFDQKNEKRTHVPTNQTILLVFQRNSSGLRCCRRPRFSTAFAVVVVAVTHSGFSLARSSFSPQLVAERERGRSHGFCRNNQKCMACEKTVYLVDRLAADNRIYHKACFRCHHCKGTLKLGNYNSFEGVLYCRPHFDQLFKATGSLNKSFDGRPKIAKPQKPIDQEKAAISNKFVGTRDKCLACKSTVCLTEKVKKMNSYFVV